MCDYSLTHLDARPAKIDDKLVVSRFPGTSSVGFRAMEGPMHQVVCVLPGTELAFAEDIRANGLLTTHQFPLRTARFRQIHTHMLATYHDALELPDGTMVLLTCLAPGQFASVLQLPAEPQTEEEAKAQTRIPINESAPMRIVEVEVVR